MEDVVLAPKTEKVNVPSKTLEPCKRLQRLEVKPYSQKETLTVVNKLITPYSDCKERQQDAVDTLNRAFNLNSK